MSDAEIATAFTVVPPQATSAFFGHRSAEATLLEAYRSGRIAHAWLIGGLQGIGKATLAYRMARFVLANPDPRSIEVQNATTLDVDPDSHAARMVKSGAHGGLLTLQRTLNEKGTLRQVITVDESRETLPFFGSTAAGEGWRVCIVDTIDDTNASAANALLKVLEEPPSRSLFLLISHAPARLLPTIRSRCRTLNLRPLSHEEVVMAMARATDLPPGQPAIVEAAALADGSVGRALSLMDSRALRLNRRVAEMLNALPRIDPMELHALGDIMPLNDRAALAAFIGGVERWLEQRVVTFGGAVQPDLPRLARLAEVWEKIGRAARETADYNLERKPLVFSVVGLLAEATA